MLVLSDVHLGSTLNAHAGEAERATSSRIDRDLVDFFDHYRAQRPLGEDGAPSDRWRLVIAGDFIDLIGVAIRTQGEALETEPDEEERAHGLGNSADHARAKLAHVARLHEPVFAALAAFVADGHALTMVHGNHDYELQWATVERSFRDLLAEHTARARTADGGSFTREDREELDRRIEFQPWFFYRGGLVYIEHGHQYDPMCATEHPMAPFSALDPRRLARGFSDVLLRYVVRPTRGMKEHGHESMSFLDYLAFGVKLGIPGMASLGLRFVRAILALLRLRRQHFGDAARALRAEHERRIALLAAATNVGLDRLRALSALQAAPITKSAIGILRSLMVDRLALHVSGVLGLLVAIGLTAFHHGAWALAIVGVLVAWAILQHLVLRGRTIDPTDALAERAHHLARLFPAAFVVMGHTHVPTRTEVADGASTYVNLGSWAEDEDPHATYRAARTHLVIHAGESGPTAELRAWDPAKKSPSRYGG